MAARSGVSPRLRNLVTEAKNRILLKYPVVFDLSTSPITPQQHAFDLLGANNRMKAEPNIAFQDLLIFKGSNCLSMQELRASRGKSSCCRSFCDQPS